jgi:two-component system, chemotaxis family, sensor kinase CheA
MAKDPYRYFRVEARDLLEQLGRGVLDLEKGLGDAQTVPRLLRLAHTLKGAARVVKQCEIADHAHEIEDLLAPLRDAPDAAPRGAVDALLKLIDKMGASVAALAQPADAAPPSAGRPPPEVALRTMRADPAEIDALLDGISQAHAKISALQRSLGAAQRARELADRLDDQLSWRRGQAQRSASGPTGPLAGELRAILGGLGRGLADGVDQLDRELRQVREAAEQLRLVPAATLFTALERTARDAAHTLGKRVRFEGRGGDVRLDADVVGALQGALHQLVRNAVAHGIESEGERLAAGKPVDGHIVIDVARRGRRAVFSCTDDGAGVDVEAVRRAAQRKGWLAPAARALDAQALLQLMLRGGLSTAATVTEVAGRGVGLDVVRDAVDGLGGEVTVQTTPGRGTTLRLDVPLSIASLDALLVEAGGVMASIPLDAVRRTVRHGTHEVARTAQGDSLVHEGQAVPHVALSCVLQPGTSPRPGRFESAVIVEGREGLVAVGVDRLLGTVRVVLRPLSAWVAAGPVVAGAFLDVEGKPQIVLDPDGLMAEARRAGAPKRPAEAARAPVLVVDDSLTTRMLEQSILESAGYLVHAAVSAEDGLEQARRHRYSLFLVDVEMPGMDGFSFIEHTRADPALREVPAILVTSRASPEDKRRGQEVGAQGYIVKSEFAQAEFLQRVQQLVQVPS